MQPIRSETVGGFLMVALSVAAVAELAVAGPALAGPRVEHVKMRFGVVAELTGVGCAPATLSRPSTGDDALSFDPAIGQDVGFFDSVVVTAATLGGGHATWTVHPTAEECAYHAGDLDWTWSTAVTGFEFWVGAGGD